MDKFFLIFTKSIFVEKFKIFVCMNRESCGSLKFFPEKYRRIKIIKPNIYEGKIKKVLGKNFVR